MCVCVCVCVCVCEFSQIMLMYKHLIGVQICPKPMHRLSWAFWHLKFLSWLLWFSILLNLYRRFLHGNNDVETIIHLSRGPIRMFMERGWVIKQKPMNKLWKSGSFPFVIHLKKGLLCYTEDAHVKRMTCKP